MALWELDAQMTIPAERTEAVLRTREFLLNLQDTQRMPRVPRQVREEALSLLKHYPIPADLHKVAEQLPDWWGSPQAVR